MVNTNDINSNRNTNNEEKVKGLDFIRQIVKDDLDTGIVKSVVTRFPPEPNGYLHIGHAKSICLNFGIAEEFGGVCNLRFDDTNPAKESEEYVNAIKKDIDWLGFETEGHIFWGSDYFDKFYEWACDLIKKGLAYVDNLSPNEIREYRGTPTKPGKNSPYRDRSPKENLDLFEKMRNGEFEDGSCILRAKIDMAHLNMNMRDPSMYRIKKIPHHNTGDKWPIYPMYDFAHGFEDSLEGITHSICTLEFENHRPLYDWFLDNVEIPGRPHQYEFARLNLTYTVMSKRSLLELVEEKLVSGWDDPRMPTISGMRRRGITPTAIKRFCKEIGVSKVNSLVDVEFLFFLLREELNKNAQRKMVVIDPLKVTIENYPEDKIEEFQSENNPQDESVGFRPVAFSKTIYVERDDFMEEPPKKYFRLFPGNEVRLKHAYYITCKDVVKDSNGEIIELICTYDPESRGGDTPDKRRVKGTLHWVSAHDAVECEIRLYDHLFTLSNMDEMEEGRDYKEYLNPESCIIRKGYGEPSIKEAKAGEPFQFLRQGYFTPDSEDFSSETPVFNRIVALRDGWAKAQRKK